MTDMQILHEKYETEYIPIWRKTWRNYPRVWIALGMIGHNHHVLDIGCREGTLTNEIAKHNSVIGIDFVEKLINIAKQNFPNLDFRVMDANKLDFPDSSFDVVFLGEVIEHIIRPRAVFNEIRRVLKSGGRLIITTPNGCSLRRRLRVLLGKKSDYDRVHYHIYSKKELIKELEESGFKILKILGDRISIKNFHLPPIYLNLCDEFIIEAVKE